MYLWWCGNVIQSFVWRYIYCALLGSSLGISDSAMCNPGWGNWEIWFHLTGMICPWAGNLTANFWKMSNPHPMPFLPPPPPALHWQVHSTVYKSYSSLRRQLYFNLIYIANDFDYCTRNNKGIRNVKASVFDRKLLRIAQNCAFCYRHKRTKIALEFKKHSFLGVCSF